MPVFWVWLLVLWIVSFFVSRLTFREWKSNVMFYGVRKLSRAMTKLSKNKGDDKIHWWEPVFEYWWGFSIKYFVPYALLFLIFYSLHADLNKAYQGYHMFWQVMGFLFPISGLLVFGISFFACKEPEPFDHDVDAAFDENDRAGTGDADKAFGANQKVIAEEGAVDDGVKAIEMAKAIGEIEAEAPEAK